MENTINIMWIIISAGLVFIMQAGFLCLETGLTRSKNSTNVAIKNIADFGVSVILFWCIGFGLMFGVSKGGWIGTTNFFPNVGQGGHMFTSAFFLFQAMFCATSVTIVSGAVAERMRFVCYIVIAAVISIFIYPIFGHWVWGGLLFDSTGWLAEIGFIDFAGSSVVHSVGGWVALSTVLIIGSRIGRFSNNGKVNNIPSGNLPIAMLGILLLFFGWFGFNGGSMLEMNKQVPGIIVNTFLAGVSGLIVSLVIGWKIRKVPDVILPMNGALAGLVSITASCHAVTSVSAVIIGAIGGIVSLGVEYVLVRKKIDDAIGAIPVHLGAGIWGTLAVALFGNPEILDTGLTQWGQFQAQCIGIIVCGVFSFGVSYIILSFLNRCFTFRVSSQDEYVGLNVSEHNAKTELNDLLSAMNHQVEKGDMSQPVFVEPFTEIGQIAERYNFVLKSFNNNQIELRKTLKDVQIAHNDLKEAQVQLLQSEKLASIGNLAAGIAHEINNPMGFIDNNIQIFNKFLVGNNKLLDNMKFIEESFKKGNVDDLSTFINKIGEIEEEVNLKYFKEELPELIKDAKIGVERVKKIVLDLRNFSREDTGQISDVDINDVLDGIIGIIWGEIKYHCELDKDYGNVSLIRGSSQKLGQVFMNLLLNASQAIKDNGKVCIKTYMKDNNVCVDIEDNGMGIEEKNLRKIFDAFYTTKPVGEGTGLGLSISSEIIKKHEGTIKVKSKVGEGTKFTMCFPTTLNTEERE